jgi:hypothetical protein
VKAAQALGEDPRALLSIAGFEVDDAPELAADRLGQLEAQVESLGSGLLDVSGQVRALTEQVGTLRSQVTRLLHPQGT